MSLAEGIQSVIFYVLSCSTCSKISHRRKAKAQAKRERAEKHILETEQPGLYRHPSPFSTNPFWDEEIQLGPAPTKKKGHQGSATRVLTTTSLNGMESVTSEENASTAAASSPTMVEREQRSSRDDWDLRRHQRGYQREDEELWGRGDSGPESPGAGQRIREVFARAGSTVGERLSALEGRLIKSTKDETSRSPYFVARNPPVNDLHPPVVSTAPLNKEATKWMLQPPPPAKVMEGKEKVSRSRSVSQGSSTRELDNLSAVSLSRQVTGRAIGERLRRGETPDMTESQTTVDFSQSQTSQQATPIQMNTIKKRWLPNSFATTMTRRLSLDSIESYTEHSHAANKSKETVMQSDQDVQTAVTGEDSSEMLVSNEAVFPVLEEDTSISCKPAALSNPSIAFGDKLAMQHTQTRPLTPAKNAMPTTLPSAASSPNGIDFSHLRHGSPKSCKQTAHVAESATSATHTKDKSSSADSAS